MPFSRNEGGQTLWFGLILGPCTAHRVWEWASSALLVDSWWIPSDSPPSRSQIPREIQAPQGSHMYIAEKGWEGLASLGHQHQPHLLVELVICPCSTFRADSRHAHQITTCAFFFKGKFTYNRIVTKYIHLMRTFTEF